MKIERTKNASKNIATGMVLRVYQMLAPFFMRTMMIYHMGVEFLGLNSLFTSILHILNLAELGVGSAMVFSMYKPIAEDDEETICALLCLYRRYYRLIGLVIAAVGLVLTPVVPKLISGDVPAQLNVYVLYLLNLGATVMTYWLFAYKNSLLQAHQRSDVSSWVTVITTTVQYALQLFIILYIKNYYLYVIVAFLTQALNNVLVAVVAGKMYPQYKPRGKLSPEKTKSINRRIADLFTAKVGSVLLNSADSVVISAFLGLSLLAIYQNYYFIVSSVVSVIEMILQSVTAGLGNSYVTETKEKNFNDLKKFTFLFMWFTGVCCSCFLALYQPFIQRWVGSHLLLDYSAVLCFVVYFFVCTFNRLLNIYKDAAGLWHEDRFRPLITALVNLGLNLLLIKPWGIYGVLLSTVISMLFVGIPWLLHNIFTMFFPRQLLLGYLKQVLQSAVVAVIAAAATMGVCALISVDLRMTLITRTAVCITVPNIVFYLCLHRSSQFRPGLQLLDRMTKNKLHIERLFFREK